MNVQNMITLFGRAVLGTVLLFIVLVVVNSTVIPQAKEAIFLINRIGWEYTILAIKIALAFAIAGVAIVYIAVSMWEGLKRYKSMSTNKTGEDHF